MYGNRPFASICFRNCHGTRTTDFYNANDYVKKSLFIGNNLAEQQQQVNIKQFNVNYNFAVDKRTERID